MKATSRAFPALVLLATLGTLTASCSERIIPPPAPTPKPSPAPPPPPPQREVLDWRDAPITPGDWTWASDGGQSVARFAGGALELRCERDGGTVTIRRAGTIAAANAPMTIATSSATRTVDAQSQAASPAGVRASIPARDSLLDAVAFSRGRFAVDVAGLPPLYVPSWPEVSRVIEDCRA